MKKIKAFFAIFLALLCFAAVLPMAMASDAYALTVSGETMSVSKGDTVTYEIKAEQKGRIYPASLHVEWNYDASVFTLIGAEIGDLYFDLFEEYFPSKIDTENNTFDGFIYSEATEGTVIRLTFQVAEDCEAGTYPITVSAGYYNDKAITENPMFAFYPEISSKYNCYSVEAQNGTITVNDHIYGAWTKLDDERHQRQCTLCGNMEYASHTWDEGEVQKAASCISEGLIVYTCKDCGDSRKETIPKTSDHVYGDWIQHSDTEHKRSCECGDTEYASHTLGGLEKHDTENHKRVCECGYASYSKHSFGAYQHHDEENHKQICACGEPLYSVHDWDAGKMTKPPQHLEEGICTHTCTICGDTKDEPIPKTTTHNYGAWQQNDADTHKRYCNCDKWDYAAHEWNAGEVTKPATNKEDGIYTYTCKVCAMAKTESIPRFEGSEGLAFRENGDGTYFVSGIGTCKDANIVIPTATPDGYPVTGIRRNAFKDNKTITGVVIPVGIQIIEKWAFKNCTALANVTFAGGLAEIGEQAFYKCESLTSVALPSGVTVLPDEIFYGCKKLRSVTLPNGLLTVGESAFYNCYVLENITVPSSVTEIGAKAFFSCRALKSISVPANVRAIGEYAFYGCQMLGKLTLFAGLETIGNHAFEACEALETVVIPDTVASIGEYAFSSCEDLKTLTLGKALVSIDAFAFENCKSLVSLTVPENVQTLGVSAFAYCSSLKEVVFSEGLLDIGSSCFAGCKKLARVIFPGSLQSIGQDVWLGTAITEVYYLGTPEQYAVLDKGFPNESKIYYYAQTKPETADGNDYWHYENGEIVLWVLYIRGDMNGDGEKNSADAIYLLRHAIMPAMYPLVQSADVNGDGAANSADAVYLLRHIIMPAMYPLK